MPAARSRAGLRDPFDRVVCGDAKEVLDRLPPASVHLAITSPPYNVRIPYRGYSDDLPP
jgi:DNA modification methylase